MWRVAGVGLAVLWASTALAQSRPDYGFAPPSDDPPPPTPTPEYPRAYAARPLLLPAGGVEGSFALRLDTSKVSGGNRSWSLNALPSVRVGLGLAEIEAGAAIYLTRDDVDAEGDVPDPDRLQNVYAIGRFTLLPETIAAAQFIVQTPGSDAVKTYVPGAFVEHKEHFGDSASLRFAAGLNYVRSSYSDDAIPTLGSIDVYGNLRAALQVTPLIALEGAAEYHYVHATTDSAFYQSYTSNLYSLGLIASVAHDVDLITVFEFNSAATGNTYTGNYDGKAIIIGVAGRRLP